MNHNTEKPLFSIIVPVYNVESYVEQALNSVLQQNFYNYEIILINDGSTDNSGDISYYYSKKYPHITFVSQPNGGLSVARNTGIELAKGEYLVFLDSDDSWQVGGGGEILSDLSNIIKINQYPDLILHSFKYIFPYGVCSTLVPFEPLGRDFVTDFNRLVKLKLYTANAWTKIVKRSVLINNHLRFVAGRNFEDQLYSVHLAYLVKSYAVYRSDFYQYRTHREGAITQSVSYKNVGDAYYIFERCCQELERLNNEQLNYGICILINRHIDYTLSFYRQLNEEDKFAFEMQYQHLLSVQNIFKRLSIES